MTTTPPVARTARAIRGPRAVRAAAVLAAAVLAGATAVVPAEAAPAPAAPAAPASVAPASVGAAQTDATQANAAPAGGLWARTARLSTGIGGAEPDHGSRATGLSADGRWAVFDSDATNIVPGDTNGTTDVFVRDLWTGRVERISLTSTGAQADGYSYEGEIDALGRSVVFTSLAGLVPEDTNGTTDVYVRDLWTGGIEWITAGGPAQLEPDRYANEPSISADGRYVAFSSTRDDLAPGASPYGTVNIYVTDRWRHTTRLLTIGADGSPANRHSFWPVISADGGRVGFISRATNLVPRTEGGTSAEEPADAQAAADEAAQPRPRRRYLHGDDTVTRPPRQYPYYVHDLASGRTTVASADESGTPHPAATGTISPDGRLAVYSYLVPNEPGSNFRHQELFVRDLGTGAVRRLPIALPGTVTTRSSSEPVVAPGNRWVYFNSDAGNLVPGDTNLAADVFRHDLWTGRTERVSVAADGSQSTGSSYDPVVGGLGTAVLFTADDGTLVEGDANFWNDAFLRRVLPF
ncbi:TolB family protein [Kitasatospora sp. NPDC057692]|uniref:TolB family protein n=1 Tax=Kitasatospora sp. NPDC057692 TaxID=3346215 RepID=UPI0036BC5CAF